jgi:hypothetical protein
MLIRITIAFAIIAALGLAFAVAVSPVSPATPAPRPSTVGSLLESRAFMLMPDGQVEITEGIARRVFRWTGEQWLEVEAATAGVARPASR